VVKKNDQSLNTAFQCWPDPNHSARSTPNNIKLAIFVEMLAVKKSGKSNRLCSVATRLIDFFRLLHAPKILKKFRMAAKFLNIF